MKYSINSAGDIVSGHLGSSFRKIPWRECTDQEVADHIIQEARDVKLEELRNYHSNSSDIRSMSINGYFILSLSFEGRNLIAEQIQQLKQKVEKGIVTEEMALFKYFYNDGSVDISLSQLQDLHIFMLDVVNTNYGIYKAHISAINNLASVNEIENYDFTINYSKNQNLNIV